MIWLVSIITGVAILVLVVSLQQKNKMVNSLKQQLGNSQQDVKQLQQLLDRNQPNYPIDHTLRNKNALLRSILDKLGKIGPVSKVSQEKLDFVIKMIGTEMTKKEDWQKYIEQFQGENPSLCSKLERKQIPLSFNEWRLIALSVNGWSTQEIASVLNVSIDAVKKARHRLRKKLDISSKVEFHLFYEEL